MSTKDSRAVSIQVESPEPYTQASFQTYSSGSGWTAAAKAIITEAPVSLTVNGAVWLTFLCTPTHLEALAAGFLFNEGLLQKETEIASIYVCAQKTNVDIWLRQNIQKPEKWSRTSGCTGGMTSLINLEGLQPVETGQRFSPAAILDNFEQLLASQALYREARGVHCSALSDGSRIHFQAEDIGRHNTIDKLAGMFVLAKAELDPKIVMTTGRISSEMLQKSARLGACVVLSRTSPTSLSIRMAQELNITLVGYARRSQFNVYTHPERMM